MLVEGAPKGFGGQGTVSKVRNLVDGRLGALKELHPTHLDDTERRQRMAREVRALLQVRGMGVPAVLDHNMDFVGKVPVSLYFVSEWVEGRTLQQHTGGKPLPIDDALIITRELAEIVARCHSVGVCHRDVKPDNIIVGEDTRIVLVDFGTAFAEPSLGESDFTTEVAQELGNRFLRIPDLAAGQPDRRDPRADVTFLVGVLFFLLTGRAPRSLVDKEMGPPHGGSPNLFPENTTADPRWTLVRRILDVGFQPPVNLRFQSVEDLLGRIDEVLDPGVPVDGTGDYRREVAALNGLLQSANAESWRRVERGMLESSRKLEDRLEAMANEAGLMSIHNAGRASVQAAGRSVVFHYSLCRPEARDPEARLEHTVELAGPNRSLVQATYRVNAQHGSTAEYHKPITYYTGPAADTERLEDELLAHDEEIFATTVTILKEKLQEALSGSDDV